MNAGGAVISFLADLLRDNLIALLVSILFGYYLHVRSKTVRNLSYQYAGLQLISNQQPQLMQAVTVSYQGVQVPQVTMTRIVVWNDGNQTLRRGDIANLDSLRLHLPQGSRFLNVQIAYAPRTVNNIQLVPDPAKPEVCHITFEFLDPDDGVRIEALHTSSTVHVTVAGTLQGIPKGIKNRGIYTELLNPPPVPTKKKWWERPKHFLWSWTGFQIAWFSFGIYCIVSSFLMTPTYEEYETRVKVVDFLFLILGIAIVALGVLFIWLGKREFPKTLLESSPSP